MNRGIKKVKVVWAAVVILVVLSMIASLVLPYLF